MRLYTFCNYYLSPIQQGIQSAHLVADMFIDHDTMSTARCRLHTWATHHKTMIVLNGGNHADISQTFIALRSLGAELELPVGMFREDDISLNHAVTCAGIVVPAEIYEYAAIRLHTPIAGVDFNLPIYEQHGLNVYQHQLAEIIKSCPLAR